MPQASNVRDAMSEEEEQGYNRYLWFITDWSKTLMEPLLHKKMTADQLPTETRQLFDTLLRGFTHINDAIRNLRLCRDFVKARAPKRAGLDPTQYLNYHVSFYLQENYVLKERLERYAKQVARIKRRRGDEEAEERFKRLDAFVHSSFKGLAGLRGQHVHVAPFVDEKIDQASMAHALSNFDAGTFKPHARALYTDARKFWVKTMTNNMGSLAKLMDWYCDFLYREITTGNNEFIPGFSGTYKARKKVPGVTFKSELWS